MKFLENPSLLSNSHWLLPRKIDKSQLGWSYLDREIFRGCRPAKSSIFSCVAYWYVTQLCLFQIILVPTETYSAWQTQSSQLEAWAMHAFSCRCGRRGMNVQMWGSFHRRVSYRSFLDLHGIHRIHLPVLEPAFPPKILFWQKCFFFSYWKWDTDFRNFEIVSCIGFLPTLRQWWIDPYKYRKCSRSIYTSSISEKRSQLFCLEIKLSLASE